MNDDKLKLILAVLGGIVFSLIFVLLAFVLPLNDNSVNQNTQVKHTLEQISKGIKEGKLNPPPSNGHDSQ